jgi:hypothetical protein
MSFDSFRGEQSIKWMSPPMWTHLSRKIDQLMATSFAHTIAPHTPIQDEACSFCFIHLHHAKDCPTVGQVFDISLEQVNAAFSRPSNDPYSNSYNPGWRNHLNFSWRAQAIENSALSQGLHNEAYPQSFVPSSNY